MLLKGQGKSPVVLPTGKTRVSPSTEGLVGLIRNIFILIDCYILNELNSAVREKGKQLDFILGIVVIPSASLPSSFENLKWVPDDLPFC